MSLVSVLVSVKDGWPHVEGAIRSILDQTKRNLELLVMDDGSTDQTSQYLQSIAEQDSRVRLFRHDTPRGLTRSLNELLQEARGEWVARQDADDYSMAHRFEHQLAALDAHPDWIAIASDYLLLTQEGEEICVQPVPTDPGALFSILNQSNIVCHGSLMIKTDTLRTIGGYCEDFPLTQDYELLLRLFAVGSVGSISEPLYAFRLSPDSLTFRNQRKQTAYLELARHKHLDAAVPAMTEYPPLPPRIAESLYHLRVGKLFLSKLNTVQGRRHLIRAFVRRPLSLETMFWTLLSFCPAFLLRTAKSIRKRPR